MVPPDYRHVVPPPTQSRNSPCPAHSALPIQCSQIRSCRGTQTVTYGAVGTHEYDHRFNRCTARSRHPRCRRRPLHAAGLTRQDQVTSKDPCYQPSLRGIDVTMLSRHYLLLRRRFVYTCARLSGLTTLYMEGKLMAAVEWLAALRRRWYLLVVATLCAGVTGWAVHARTIPYQGCEGLYLSGPTAARSAYLDGNPLYGNQSVVIATAIVTQTMMSQPIQRQLGRSGVPSGYSVTMTNTGDPRFPTYSQPTVQICVAAASSRGVLKSIETVADQFRLTLRAIQSQQHVNADSFITVETIIQPFSGPVIGRPSQAELGVLLVGLLVGIALTTRTDRFLQRRRSPMQ